MDEKQLWEKAVAFHGHVCGGLMIGYKASLYAIELLGLTFSDGERCWGAAWERETSCSTCGESRRFPSTAAAPDSPSGWFCGQSPGG